VQLDAQVRNRVRQREASLDRRRVDAILDHHRLERSPLEDRLAHDAVLPADDLALVVERGPHAVDPERPVEPATDVVLARPDDLDRGGDALLLRGLRDVHGLADEVAARARAPPKPPPK
jgi:hypothetical protein